MRQLHFDCFSGISGDMTLAALIDLGVDPELVRRGLASLNLPIALEVERVKRNGIAATRVVVQAPDQQDHRHLHHIEAIIDAGALSESQRQLARAIFRRLGEAEASVHGTDLQKVHFHEVGALDSIADIVGCAIALDSLGVGRFTSRSVPPGSGTVKCAHGIMPIPAPATAKLLQGVPLATAAVKGELVTPTGAAILTTLVSEYTDQPQMRIERIGCGAGTRDPWEQPNVLRLFLGEAVGLSPDHSDDLERDQVTLLETNLDDCPAEWVAYACEELLSRGALDVFTQAIQMKKGRPGVLLSVLCEPERAGELERILFRETGTFGVRRSSRERSKLRREPVSVPTPWGPVQAKRGRGPHGEWVTPEYEACAAVARTHGVPLRAVYEAVRKGATADANG